MRRLRYELAPYMHEKFCFEAWKGKRVLEIGSGSGIDAVEYAKNGALVYATDMTESAVNYIRNLFSELNVKAERIEMVNGENLPYEDEYFDLVYTFGVIHHSKNDEKILQEIHRVLKKDGECYAMVYHKNSLLYYYSIVYLRGVANHGFAEGLKEQEILSKYSEGKHGCPYTRVYTVEEAKTLFKDFENVDVSVDYPVIDTMEIRKIKIPALPKSLGWHLIIRAQKK
jgi:ubiquinone/menaquinone biosynthesis C-methylase UbiE